MGELYLDGVIEDIIYSNSENGYTVCTVNCGGEPITLVGIMPYVGEGESVRVQGEWQVHSTFGRQFRVDYFEKKLEKREDRGEKQEEKQEGLLEKKEEKK